MSSIWHGDCLELMANIPDGSVDMVLCDPPYGIDFQSNRRKDKSKRMNKIANDKAPFVSWTDDAFRVLKHGGCILCFTRWDVESVFRDALDASGFKTKQQLIWDKCVHGMGDLSGDFASQHENIIFATKGKFRFSGKRPTSIFRYSRVAPKDLIHPNEKPISLLSDLINSVSIEDDTVLDCFAGSGTTGVACLNTNRRYILIEKEQKYYDICVRRCAEAKQNLIVTQDA